jgi:hypothetical protein
MIEPPNPWGQVVNYAKYDEDELYDLAGREIKNLRKVIPYPLRVLKVGYPECHAVVICEGDYKKMKTMREKINALAQGLEAVYHHKITTNIEGPDVYGIGKKIEEMGGEENLLNALMGLCARICREIENAENEEYD